jgi:molecular chaperone GrpE
MDNEETLVPDGPLADREPAEGIPEPDQPGPPPDEDMPGADGEVQELKAQLAQAKAIADEYLDGWQRARAEFANYKNRMKRDEHEASAQATVALLARSLPVLDDLERALRDRPREGDSAVWAEGIELIHRKLKAILESEGVETIPADGMAFDPTLHEALSHEVSADHAEGQVIAVVQPGYRIGDRILRPALVRVAK